MHHGKVDVIKIWGKLLENIHCESYLGILYLALFFKFPNNSEELLLKSSCDSF